MKHDARLRLIAHIYLCMVPFIAFILAFAVGHVSASVYVPVWLVHAVVMLFVTWLVGVRYTKRTNKRSVLFAVAGVLMVLPWVLATIFAGMGPPPFTISAWAELADEQRFRFGILVVCGGSLAAGLSILYELA